MKPFGVGKGWFERYQRFHIRSLVLMGPNLETSKVSCMKPFVNAGGGCYGKASKISPLKPVADGCGCFESHQRFHIQRHLLLVVVKRTIEGFMHETFCC